MTDVPEPSVVDASDPPPGGPAGAGVAALTRHQDKTTGARIVVKKLGKAYIHGGKALPILWDIDMELDRGDMVAVVGASGVGKSTFLQILGT
ncbi:MAG: ATP-binding cassette domain-containing protein, partial [Kofleriaceae bacterium]